jgi:hypothetical protein
VLEEQTTRRQHTEPLAAISHTLGVECVDAWIIALLPRSTPKQATNHNEKAKASTGRGSQPRPRAEGVDRGFFRPHWPFAGRAQGLARLLKGAYPQ